MPRRNPDRIEPQPLAITPADVEPPRRRERTTDRRRTREADDRYRQARDAAARRKRVAEAIRWDMCCVPGCLAKIPKPMDVLRDVDRALPICSYHAVIVKRQIDTAWEDEGVLALRKEVQAHQDQLLDGQERAIIVRENSRHGQLYILRANGLIKVGWSSDLPKRLKAYGPDVQLLCHYPGFSYGRDTPTPPTPAVPSQGSRVVRRLQTHRGRRCTSHQATRPPQHVGVLDRTETARHQDTTQRPTFGRW